MSKVGPAIDPGLRDVFEANGAKFYAQNDMIVKWCRREEKPFEPVTTRFILEGLAARAGRFLDVGASTGWFAIPAALRGHLVTAFEPNVRVVQRLEANMALNGIGWDRLELIRAAASHEPGQVVFFYNPLVPLTSGGSIAQPTCKGPVREMVDAVTLDASVPRWDEVALIKIDVEGHERFVLEGAKGIIRESRPLLVLEANTEGHKAALAMWLAENAYSWEEADGRNLLCRPLALE